MDCLTCHSVYGIKLQAGDFVVSREASHECVSDHAINFFAEDWKEVLGVVVEYFIDNHRLYLGAVGPTR